MPYFLKYSPEEITSSWNER